MGNKTQRSLAARNVKVQGEMSIDLQLPLLSLGETETVTSLAYTSLRSVFSISPDLTWSHQSTQEIGMIDTIRCVESRL